MKHVLEYLERTAGRLPDKIAVDDGRKRYRYGELRALAKKAGVCIAKKTAFQKPVIVFLEKSADVLAVLFGVAYAGCFYVPVNPDFPSARIRKLLEILDASCAVTESRYMEKLRECGFSGSILELAHVFDGEEEAEAGRRAQEGDLLYGMFTSGSTGVPKLVTVSHRAVLDFIEDFMEIGGITEDDCIGNQAPFDFDVSVKDIYAAVCSGATLALIPKELFSKPGLLLARLSEQNVTVLIWAVTALCMATREPEFCRMIPKSIRKVFFSGEVMPPGQLKIIRDALPEAVCYNLYGPTEVTCNCTWHRIAPDDPIGSKIPIGKPFPKRKIWLLDEKQEAIRQPNCTGEICVGGNTLASGYYHNEDEQAKRFVKHSFEGGAAELTYHTGDLGYYDAQGRLYFAGRMDFQIKRLGHRVELEEIELEMAKIQGVLQTCCIYDAEHQALVAFYIGTAERGEVRRELRRSLPAYMLPNRIVRLCAFPVNQNGKTDRARLKREQDEQFRYGTEGKGGQR